MSKLDKRDEIVRVSLEIIAEHGFHDAPMAVIAKKAGGGAGTIYHYFENKDALIKALHHELELRIYPAVQDNYVLQQPVRNRFRHLMTALLHFFGKPHYKTRRRVVCFEGGLSKMVAIADKEIKQ